jgi:protein-S-isoprenylcysteine O-methyltransferase
VRRVDVWSSADIFGNVRPLVWTNPVATAVAVLPFVWLLVIETGTSRRVPPSEREDDIELDTATGHLFDVLVSIAMATAVAASLRWTGTAITPRAVALGAGVVLMSSAIALSVWARHHLGRFHRHALTSHHDHELVTSGPYRFVRHPIYSATVLAFTGTGAALGTWVGVLVLVSLPTGALARRIVVEEAILRARLGDRYVAYCVDRARLVPHTW